MRGKCVGKRAQVTAASGKETQQGPQVTPTRQRQAQVLAVSCEVEGTAVG